jgi:hypothetical protein
MCCPRGACAELAALLAGLQAPADPEHGALLAVAGTLLAQVRRGECQGGEDGSRLGLQTAAMFTMGIYGGLR